MLRRTGARAEPHPSRSARRVFLGGLVAGLLAVGLLIVLQPSPGYPAGAVTLATGGVKGVYATYGEELARIATRDLEGVQASALVTSGSVENLRRVGAGSVLVGFSTADAAGDARYGRPPFEQPLPVVAVGRIYDDYVHLVVRRDSTARSVADLRRLRVSLGSRGSGTELIADRVLASAGLSRHDVRARHLGLGQSVEAMLRGDLEAFFWSGGLPTLGVTELAERLPVRLLPLGDVADRLRTDFGAAYRRARLPAGTYPGIDPVETVAVPNYLVTREDADPHLVAEFTRLLFASRAELARDVPLASGLDVRGAIYTSPLPLHPGAQRYYRTAKS
jgi:TRAP transporter TAXI family solute receptor